MDDGKQNLVSTFKGITVKKKRLSNNLDSTCVLISQQLCFHSARKHENDVSKLVASISKL